MIFTQRVRNLIFNLIHGHHLVYNSCWEDPRLDRCALNLVPDDTVLVITSAGCNVLDYALDKPRHIYAVDVNPRQNALLELKIAAIRHLAYDDFFSIFGRGHLPRFPKIYVRTLRPALTRKARAYWDQHTGYFTGRSKQRSFYYHGSSGWVARFINFYIDRVACVRDQVDALMKATTLVQQKRIYQEVQDAFWSKPLCWVLGRDSFLSMLGIPRSQRLQIEKHYAGGIVGFMQQCLGYVFMHLPLFENYFWRVYLYGRYEASCCPAYLKPENFKTLREDGIHRISIHTGSIEGFLRTCNLPVSRFVLPDHMDWMSSFDLPALQREWQAIIDHATSPARLIWRSGALKVDYVDSLPVKEGGRHTHVGNLLTYHSKLARRLHAQDRVGTYGSFYIADMAVA